MKVRHKVLIARRLINLLEVLMYRRIAARLDSVDEQEVDHALCVFLVLSCNSDIQLAEEHRLLPALSRHISKTIGPRSSDEGLRQNATCSKWPWYFIPRGMPIHQIFTETRRPHAMFMKALRLLTLLYNLSIVDKNCKKLGRDSNVRALMAVVLETLDVEEFPRDELGQMAMKTLGNLGSSMILSPKQEKGFVIVDNLWT